MCQAYEQLRQLLKKIGHNIEILDPQLKNNADLVQALTKFEDNWSLAMNQISDASRFQQLRSFSSTIETVMKKYPLYKENLECRDASIFMSLPSLFVLRSLQQKKVTEEEPVYKQGIKRFDPKMLESELYKNTEQLFDSSESFREQGSKTLASLEAIILEIQPDKQ